MIRNVVILFLLLPIVFSQTATEVSSSLEDLIAQAANYTYPEDYREFYHQNIKSEGEYGEYDFIIIGAGSAGTYLASSLSEISDWSILLLEAGHNETLYTDVPAMAGVLQSSEVNWGYQTIPQKTCCLGMENNICNSPRGKVLGGSSTINYMIYSRGNAKDYDDWEKAGNSGWSYKEVLPYFIKVENSSLTENVDYEYHGKNGRLHVEHIRNFGDLGQAYLDANVERGRKILDYNGQDEMGFSKIQSTTINGRRCSGNKAFLNPAIPRENLKVVTGAFVTKLNIDKRNADKSRVNSVEFLLGNKKYFATSRFEFILSAGAVGSPQILLHSGIGPKEELENLGIEVIEDLPVGRNLHDHPVIPYAFNTTYVDPNYKPMTEMVSDYLKGFGYLTAAGNMQSIGFINTEDENNLVPDLEHLMSPFFDLNGDALKVLFNLKNETISDLLKGSGSSFGVYIQVLLHPKSRGSIRLKSNNVFDHPLIDYKYYSNPEDLEPMVRGLKYLFSLGETESMKRFNVTLLHNPLRACPQEFLSDGYLRCYLRQMTSTLYHLAGTCKMGPNCDPEAVVDDKLRVKGVENLRVIDASIIPTPVSGHNNAPTYMIAAKGADMIKDCWKFGISK